MSNSTSSFAKTAGKCAWKDHRGIPRRAVRHMWSGPRPSRMVDEATETCLKCGRRRIVRMTPHGPGAVLRYEDASA